MTPRQILHLCKCVQKSLIKGVLVFDLIKGIAKLRKGKPRSLKRFLPRKQIRQQLRHTLLLQKLMLGFV